MSIPRPEGGRGKSGGATAQRRQRPSGGLLVGTRSTVPKQEGGGEEMLRTVSPATLPTPVSASPWPSPSEIRGQANLKDSVQGLQLALDREQGGEGQRVGRPSGGAGGGCYGLNVWSPTKIHTLKT